MMVLEKTPDLAQRRQVFDLGLGELAEGEPRTAVKLVVEIEGCLGMLDLRRLPDGLAIDRRGQPCRLRI